jgi:ABC-2 type transport system permease protein
MNDILRLNKKVNQPVLFQRLRWRLLHNSTSVVLRSSPVRLISILLCSVLVWGGIFAASAWGFYELHVQNIPFAGAIIGTVFDLLFLALAVMLIFSSGIILYSSLFSSAETTFLLSTPTAADQVFAYKYQGALTFSSWAFILLGSPILIAYGLVFGVPWSFYALLPLFFVGFVLLPGSVGALFCLLIVNYLPQRRKQVLVAAGFLVLVLAAWWIYRVLISTRSAMMDVNADGRPHSDALEQLFGQLTFARGVLFPSHWMTRGLEAAARGELMSALYPLALVWSNGLFLYVVAAWISSRLYRRGYNRLATGGKLRRRYGGSWLDWAMAGLLRFLHAQTRLLIIKDFRTFRRDPAQWAQILIFAGLVTFYTANTRRFYSDDIGRLYQNGISLLNLAATAFLLCAYTGRFIFPMLSLEGQKFWILGLLPLPRQRLLWGKFAFSATGSLLIAELLVSFSDLLLGVGWYVMGLHALTVVVLAVGLSGLSVGLGAVMPNFRESDPSKIAVGFGGTLNLVTGLLFLLVVIGLMAAPYHVYTATAREVERIGTTTFWWLTAAAVAGMILGFLATVIPLRMGARALRQMEF